jgi:hypothetical protein
MRAARVLFASAAATALLLVAWTGTASATFHLMQVREVYPGSAANPDAEYVELQMWASGQNLVAGHFVRSYGSAGNVIATSTFPTDVPNAANQSTLLLATPQAEAEFGVAADASLSPAGQLSPAGGAVCWEAIDCVAWGSFSGSLPSPAGTPVAAAGIPDGMAIRRSIDRGCPTALDLEDDHDNSAADFAVVFPTPRPNSLPPTEKPCSGGTGGGSGLPSGPGGPPQTTLRQKPPKRTRDRTPTFRFVADEADARFQCKLDRKPFRACRSPYTTRRLALGRHSFRVRAVDSSGRADPTPALWRFRVVRRG